MDGPTHVPPGGVLVYTLTVANAGPSLMGLTTLTVSNPTNIVINDDARATPYPSTLTVTGLTPLLGTAAGVYNFQHSYPEDVDVLLVAPGGQQTILMSDPAGADDAFGVNLRFDDTSPDTLPCVNAVLDSGAYRPTDCAGTFGDDLFPAPAPAGPYTATMSVFNGADPTGTWRLYVRDDAPGDTGFIGGGWSLSLTSDRGNMVVTDTLPLGAVFLGASGAGWNCTPIGAEVRCVAPSFAFGTAPNLVLQATTPVTPGLLINRAVLGSGIFDPAPLNNQAVVTNTLFGMYIPLYMK
jgi:subtilisin-like proprotein convertase family protein